MSILLCLSISLILSHSHTSSYQIVFSLKCSTTINGGENSSSVEFEEQLTPKEEAIMDEIKQLADIVNKYEENFAEINQTLGALQQQINLQIQLSTPTV